MENLRLNKNVGQLITYIEEIITVKIGMSKALTEMNPADRYWTKTWIDCMNNYLCDRDIIIINKHNNYQSITQNQIIIEYVTVYVRQVANAKRA